MLAVRSAEFASSVFDFRKFKGRNLPEIAFAGRSNVGKSSMLNQLIGRRSLAKTSRTPGKTQSLNFYLVNGRFYFVDLPGFGYARVSAERRENWGRLLTDYFDRSTQLRGLVHLVDCRHDPTELDLELRRMIAERSLSSLTVLTKADKLSRAQLVRAIERATTILSLPAQGLIAFSAMTGLGKTEILGWIESRLVAD